MGWTSLVRHYRLRDWRDPRLEVRPSLIHGNGLIALRPIKRGEVVMIFGGTLFSREDIVAGKANARTLMQIGEESWLGNRAEEPLSEDYFINHSCDPNLWMQDEVTLTARRSITAGEEAAMDYAMHFADPAWTMRQPCSCGSSLCRGQIRGTDWMLDDLQKRYLGHFSPLVNQRIAHLQKSKPKQHA
jgi:SET domain-containing protein